MKTTQNQIGFMRFTYETRGLHGLISECLKATALVLLILVDIIMLSPLLDSQARIRLLPVWLCGFALAYVLYKDITESPSWKCELQGKYFERNLRRMKHEGKL